MHASSKYEELGLLGEGATQEDYNDLGEKTGRKVVRTIVQLSSTDRVKFWTNAVAKAVKEESGVVLNKEPLRSLFRKSKTFGLNDASDDEGVPEDETEDGRAEDKLEDGEEGEHDQGDGEDSGSVYAVSSSASEESKDGEFVVQDNKLKRRKPMTKTGPKKAACPIGPLEKS